MGQTHMIVEETSDAYLDGEWLQLIREAREIGLSYEEVQGFLRNVSEKKVL